MKQILATALILTGLASAASAQDFGRKWIDDVSNELMRERGPIDPRPVKPQITLGGLYVYDDNIYLESTNEDSDSIFIPWGRARLDYAESTWSATVDALAAYKIYLDEDDLDDDEEKVFARIGTIGSNYAANASVVWQHMSDPTGVIFADRIERHVGNVYADASYDITPAIAVEWNGQVGAVRMLDAAFDKIDNMNYRTDLGVVWRTPYRYDLLVQGGVLGIDYRYETSAPPDVDGTYVRGGIRGEILPRLRLWALAGWTSAESEDFPNGQNEEVNTGDASIHAKYEATDKITLFAGYDRMVTFAAGTDPFQVINRATFIAELAPIEQFNVRGRFQYDDSHSALGVERDYLSVGGTANYTYMKGVVFSAGITHRQGEIEDTPFDYDNLIFTLGVGLSN